jgi:hypothetical protein
MTPSASDPIMPAAQLDVPPPMQPRDAVDRPAMVNATRIVETRQLYPGYVIPLTALTVAFLAVELAFTSRLLDAIGNTISERQLAGLAAWGWVLTGIALTLLVWGSFILPRAYRKEWPARRSAAALLLTALVCCETVYLVGPGLTGLSVDRMTAQERRCAVQLRVLAIARQDDAVPTAPPGVQWAIIRAPFAGLACAGLPAASRDGLGEALQGMVARQQGTADQVYNNIFIPSVRSLRDAYNEYVAAQLRLVADIRAIPDQQSQAWQRHVDRLARAGQSPTTRIPRRDWPRIAADVREMGVQVSPDWNPGDQAAFNDAVAMASRKTADAAYVDFVVKHFQQALPPGLDWDGFCGQPPIQARWRALIDAPADTNLSPNMGFPAFRQTVYDPRVDRLVQPRLNDLLDSPDRFAPDGSWGQAGRAAAYWVIVPSLLFTVALVCILWHAARLFDLACSILLPRVIAPRRWAAEACLAAAVVILFLGWRTPQPTGATQSGSTTSVLWPIGSTLRNAILFGFDFGYDAGSAGDPGEAALEPLLPRVPPRP